jgi:hypothetical protein
VPRLEGVAISGSSDERSAVPQAEAPAGVFQEEVIVRVLVVRLYQIVV